jgi:hypothetical protein
MFPQHAAQRREAQRESSYKQDRSDDTAWEAGEEWKGQQPLQRNRKQDGHREQHWRIYG